MFRQPIPEAVVIVRFAEVALSIHREPFDKVTF